MEASTEVMTPETAPAPDSGAFSSDTMMANIDTPTDNTETSRTVDPGGSISFDELESLGNAETTQQVAEAKQEVQKEKIKDKVKAEEAETDDKPQKSNDDSEADDAAEEEEAGKSEESETEEEKEPAKVARADGKGSKTHKVSVDGKDLDLPNDTMFQVKVDGQDTEVTLQDALNSFSGHEAVKTRFNDLAQEKQKLVENQRTIDENINKIFQLADQGKPQEALMGFFKGLGVEPIQAMETLRNQFWTEAQKLQEMSEPERKAYEAELRTENYKAHYETAREQEAAQAQQQEMNAEIVNLQKSHNINDEIFDRTAEELLTLRNEGKLNRDITPQLVIQTALYDRQVEEAQGMLETINPDSVLSENIDKVVTMLNAGSTIEEVREFAQFKWGQENPAAALSKKVEKSSGTDATKQAPKNADKEDVWTFDQVDF